MQSTFALRMAAVLFVLGWLTGCAHRPINAPLTQWSPTNGYYFHSHPRTNNSPETLFILAFSGGGSRAAALGYGVLQELAGTTYPFEGQTRSLLNEVDAISAVSGGSFTAAAYGLYGDEIFSRFEHDFLKRNVQGNLVWKTLNPLHWPSLFSSHYGRSELAAEYYDRILFHGATYADLIARPGPFIVINATDISIGARFSFTQSRFNYLNSDLTPFPLSRACAASSAVPAVLTPVTLNNYDTDSGFTPPEWVKSNDPKQPARMRLFARELRSYLDHTNRPYIHLVDGGVSDNLGLREILDDVAYYENTPALRTSVDISRLKRVVVLSANAYSSPERDWDQHESPPGSLATAVAASSHTLDRFSFETLELLRGAFDKWQKDYGQDEKLKFYSVMINFTNFKDLNERRFFLNLPTSFVLSPTDVDKLVDAGRRLLRSNETYQRLLGELGGQSGPPLDAPPK